MPIVGDWDGDGVDTPGFYRPSRELALSNRTGTQIEMVFTLGNPGADWLPLVGKW